MPRLTPEAIAALRQAQEDIVQHADQFYMGDWLQRDPTRHGGCGTAGCIAGWIAARSKLKDSYWEPMSEYVLNPSAVAHKILGGITFLSSQLFFTSSWPKELRELHSVSNGGGDRMGAAIVAAAAIEVFIQQDGDFRSMWNQETPGILDTLEEVRKRFTQTTETAAHVEQPAEVEVKQHVQRQ